MQERCQLCATVFNIDLVKRVLQVFSHQFRRLFLLVLSQGIDDSNVLFAPLFYAALIVIAAKFQQTAQPVLLLDSLYHKQIAAGFRQQLMK